jgi:hypothetical protein
VARFALIAGRVLPERGRGRCCRRHRLEEARVSRTSRRGRRVLVTPPTGPTYQAHLLMRLGRFCLLRSAGGWELWWTDRQPQGGP